MNPATAKEKITADQITAGPDPVEPELLSAAIEETERQVHLTAKQFAHKQRLADLFAQSGCFQDIKKDITPTQALAQAFVKIELGESMGFSPAESMQGVQLIQGTPAVSAALRAARMQRAGFTWDIDWFEDDKGVCTGCRIWLNYKGKPLMKPVRDAKTGLPMFGPNNEPLMEQVSEAFMKSDAERLKTKIWENNGSQRTSRTASVLEKDNWQNTPRNMYFARCITNAQRFHAPGVLSGEIMSAEEVIDRPDPEDDFRYGGSKEAQDYVMKFKLANIAREAIEETQKAPNEAAPPVSETKQPEQETKELKPETPEQSAETPKSQKTVPVFGKKP